MSLKLKHIVTFLKIISNTYQKIHEYNGNHHTEQADDNRRELWDRSKRGSGFFVVLVLGLNYDRVVINLAYHHNKCLEKRPGQTVENILRDEIKRIYQCVNITLRHYTTGWPLRKERLSRFSF